MAEIDPKRLPKSAMLDTTVAIRAMGDQSDDPRSPLCRELLDAMFAQKTLILIAAPTLAEIYRAGSGKAPPHMANFYVTPFDDEAARILGTKFPSHALTTLQKESGDPLSYYKYDALIVACAMRHHAEALVTLDNKMITLAKTVSQIAVTPDEYKFDGSLGL